MDLSEIGILIVMQALSGLSRAMVLFVVASGLSLIFGTLSVPNFAHGSFYMIGAFICYQFWRLLGAGGIAFWSSLLIAFIAMGIIGFLFEAVFLRRVYARGHIPQLLLTFGLTLVVFDTVRLIWGAKLYSVTAPEILSGSLPMFGTVFPIYNMFIILAGLVIFGGLHTLIYRTKLGCIVRAAVFDREMVAAIGIPIPLLFALVFSVGTGLAGLAAGLAAPLGGLGIGMDVSILIDCFAVVIIGGVGNITGTLLGAIIVGMAYAFGILVLPKMAISFMFIILAVVLVLWPQGLLGKRM